MKANGITRPSWEAAEKFLNVERRQAAEQDEKGSWVNHWFMVDADVAWMWDTKGKEWREVVPPRAGKKAQRWSSPEADLP